MLLEPLEAVDVDPVDRSSSLSVGKSPGLLNTKKVYESLGMRSSMSLDLVPCNSMPNSGAWCLDLQWCCRFSPNHLSLGGWTSMAMEPRSWEVKDSFGVSHLAGSFF